MQEAIALNDVFQPIIHMEALTKEIRPSEHGWRCFESTGDFVAITYDAAKQERHVWFKGVGGAGWDLVQ